MQKKPHRFESEQHPRRVLPYIDQSSNDLVQNTTPKESPKKMVMMDKQDTRPGGSPRADFELIRIKPKEL
jgi:hypothetical protein